MRRITATIARIGRRLGPFAADRRGAVAIEYAILAVMIGLALIGMSSLTGFSERLSNTFYSIAENHLRR